MPISRRKFIQLSSLTTASMLVPQFLKAFARRESPGEGKILIVVQLSGGNDGLNTVIPVRNDIYYRSRPGLAIPRAEALALDKDTGLHPALKGIKALYDEGYVSILNGVGYPEPDRSHFRSMDIWQSGSASSEVVTTGWLGRYLDASRGERPELLGLEVDDTLSLALKGNERKGIAVRDVAQFYKAAGDPFFRQIARTHEEEHEDELASYLYRTLRETTSAADYVFEHSKAGKPAADYPDTQLGRRMKTIASLILAGSATKVYYVSHGSFDTHTGQKERQKQLFTQLDEVLTALVKDMQDNNRFKDVMIVTFSEFGRRVAQNASGGTDHGTAGNMFVLSGGLRKAGLYNELPSLGNLDDGDLRHSLDFKQVYATILDKWLDADADALLGRKYRTLNFV